MGCGASKNGGKEQVQFQDSMVPTNTTPARRRVKKGGANASPEPPPVNGTPGKKGRRTKRNGKSVDTTDDEGSQSDATPTRKESLKKTKKKVKGKKKSKPTPKAGGAGSEPNGNGQAHDSSNISKSLPLPLLNQAGSASDYYGNALPGTFTVICNACTPSERGGLTVAVREPDGKVHAVDWTDKQFETFRASNAIKLPWALFFKALATAFSQGTPRVMQSESGQIQLDMQLRHENGKRTENDVTLDLHLVGNGPEHTTRYFVDPFMEFFKSHAKQAEPEAMRMEGKLFEAERRRRAYAATISKVEMERTSMQKQIDTKRKARRQSYRGREMHYMDTLYNVGGARAFNGHISYTNPYNPADRQHKVDPKTIRLLEDRFSKAAIGSTPVEEHHERILAQVGEKEKDLLVTLNDVDKWDFNVFELDSMTQGASLFHTAYALFTKYNLLNELGINKDVFCKFLTSVQAGYRPNSYHNSIHAADVLHVTHFLLSPGGLKDLVHLSPLDIFSVLFAAVIHDYDHPGFNNNFHTKTSSYLATLYNDRSVLENHHCASVFEMMYDSRYDVFHGFTDEQRKEVRETVIELVLSTDMGNHARLISSFKRRLNETDAWDSKREDLKLALVMSIKTADISNCARPTSLYLKWAHNVAEEFYTQGDKEELASLPISPFMDRRKKNTDLAKGQMSFINFIVMPLFQTMSELLPNLSFCMGHCESNRERWLNADKQGEKA